MYVYVIQTFDGPAVYGPFDTEAEALDAAYADLICSGIVADRAEAEAYYATESDVWVTSLHGAGSTS